jgi:hypothetical protein
MCADIIARQAAAALDDLRRRMGELGLAGRWEDDYLAVKIDAGLLLDILGRLNTSSAVSVLEHAVQAVEPWMKDWVVGVAGPFLGSDQPTSAGDGCDVQLLRALG